MSQPPAVSGVIETALYVADLEVSGAFYEDVLGFRPLLADARMRAYAVAGRQVLLLFKVGGSTEPTRMHGGTIPPHDGRGTQHLAFAVGEDTRDAWAAHLEAHGVAIESRVHCGDGRPSGDSLYFRDPDGHSLELLSPGCWPIY